MYSFKDGDDSKNQLKCVSKSQSKHIKFEKYKNCLQGKEYQRECDKHLLRSINHEMFLQKVRKSVLALLDDTRCYESNIKSLPWN